MIRSAQEGRTLARPCINSAAASIRSLAERTLGMTIVQEITFALLAAVGAVAGSELIVRVWQFFQLLL